MDHLRGLAYMGLVIAFILVSSFFFEGNPLNDDDCVRYSNLANDC